MLFEMELEGQKVDLDLMSMTIREGAECERLTGWTWDEWRIELGKGKSIAVAYAWWLSNKRNGTPLPGRFGDVDFDMGGLKFRRVDAPEDEELASEEEESGPALPTGQDPEGSSPD